MLQNILNFVQNYFVLIIIIGGGLFNVAVRLAQKASEQRVKREALHAMEAQKQEALRTGRPIASVSSQPQAQAKPAQDDRRDRIERLRQERMEQLRALREKRAGATPQAGPAIVSPPTSRPRPVSNPVPIPVQTQPRPQRVAQPRPQQPAQRRTPLPQAGQSQRPSRPTIIATPQQAPSERRRQRPAQQAAAVRNPQRVQRTKAKDSRHAGHVESLRESKNPSLHETIHTSRPLQASQSARSMLRSRASIRQAIVLNEILDQPVALRDQGIASGSLFS